MVLECFDRKNSAIGACSEWDPGMTPEQNPGMTPGCWILHFVHATYSLSSRPRRECEPNACAGEAHQGKSIGQHFSLGTPSILLVIVPPKHQLESHTDYLELNSKLALRRTKAGLTVSGSGWFRVTTPPHATSILEGSTKQAFFTFLGVIEPFQC